MGIIQKAGVQPIGAPSGVYFEWDEEPEADLLGLPSLFQVTPKAS